MLLATSCPGCGVAGPAPCPACVATMVRSTLLPVPPSFDQARALLAYEGAAREVVAQLKYRNARASARWLAGGLARLLPPEMIATTDVVTWAPTTDLRRRSRGFDHAELLARRVARVVGLPCRSLLHRIPGPPQTGRTLTERRDGPMFVAVSDLHGAHVIVVDDVITTGATMESAGRTLRAAGSGWLYALAAAHPR